MKRIIYLMVLLTAAAFSVRAQTGQIPSDAELARKPLWIAMLDDTTANYFVVERAFNIYFAHHELPEGEHEDIGEHREREKTPSRRKQRRIDKENALRMDVKRYNLWHEQTLPYVQPDGRILTPTERLAIWKAQQK